MKLILLIVPLCALALPQNQRDPDTLVWNARLSGAAPDNSQQNITQRALDSISSDESSTCAGPNTECVPYYMCSNQVALESLGLIDIPLREDGSCLASLDVCCYGANKTSEPLIEAPKLTTTGCGFRSIDGIGFRLSGGKDSETQFGEFPWMTAVLQKEQRPGGETNLYLCGGSLIHPRVVLTAAHCVAEKPNNILKVRLGEWDTQTTAEPLPYQDRNVVEVNIHPGFKKDALANDIALLFLETPVTIAENVKTVCLPPTTENFDYRRCHATGWGKEKFGAEGKYQVILKKVDLPVIPPSECQSALRSTRLSKFFELHGSFICAGGEQGQDTCKGDGGSPLVCSVPGSSSQYYQAGIVAWGIGCGNSNIPGVYVKVSHFKDWIDRAFEEKGFERSSYTV